jgi:hypothetical protein
VKSHQKCGALCRPLLLAAAVGLLAVPSARSQTYGGGLASSETSGSPSTKAETSASVIPAVGSESHYTWIEQFEGSSNAEGQVMLLDSSAGYVFGRHLLVDGGLPVYFIRATTTSTSGTSTTNSFSALGDIYGQVRLSFPNPAVNFKTQFTGRAPTGSTTDGISTGHATYDWTNRVDRGFGNWTPFFEVGLADSIPEEFIYKRSFASYGELAHFQLGAQYRVAEWLGVAASAFDVAPWGTQTIDSRVQKTKVTGGSNLAEDNGFSVGADLWPARAIDFTVGYSRSTHYHLNTISFGVVVNMREGLRRPGL